MDETPRDIPEPIMRQLRQEAGFGCCICGNPIYDYQHIIPFSISKEHNTENMMLLCPNHHRNATLGGLSEEDQRNAKNKPYNIIRGFVNGQLHIHNSVIAIEAGTNYFVGEGFKFLVDKTPLLSISKDDGGRLLLNIELYNSKNILLLSITENQWRSGDILPWDIIFGLRTLIIRHAYHNLSLNIDARHIPISIRGSLQKEGQVFSIKKNKLEFNGVVKELGLINLGFICSMLVADTTKKVFTNVPDPQYKGAGIISWADPKERLIKCIEAYRKYCP